jgi:hypothetical protein
MASDPAAVEGQSSDGAAAPDPSLSPQSILHRARVHSGAYSPSVDGDATGMPPPDPEQALNESSEREKLRIKGLGEFFEMRMTWSRWLIAWVTGLIVFQVLLTVAIGTGALVFQGHETFLNLTVGQNFVQVVAMAVIVLRFLHSRSKDDEPFG